MMYYQKYLKYKIKYLYIKNNQHGGNRIKLTNNNVVIQKIKTNRKLENYKEKIINITKVCEPDDFFNPELNEPYDIFWIIKYKEDNEIIGYLKSSNLEQFKGDSNFEIIGGIKNKKGLQVSGICNGFPNIYSNMATILLNKIEKYALENNYDYILLHAGTTREYLISESERKGLYIKNGYKKIKILKAGEGNFSDIDLWIMRKNI